MRKIFFVFAFAMIMSQIASAQAAESIFFEIGGPGLASMNFDTRFGAREGGLGGRVGIGGLSVAGSGVIVFPLALNYLLGKDTKNYFELGIGITPLIASGDIVEDGNFSTTFGHLNFGYRLQPLEGGVTFRAFISPIFGKGFFIPYFGGVSFGYKF